jgi:hypothetical protein
MHAKPGVIHCNKIEVWCKNLVSPLVETVAIATD